MIKLVDTALFIPTSRIHLPVGSGRAILRPLFCRGAMPERNRPGDGAQRVELERGSRTSTSATGSWSFRARSAALKASTSERWARIPSRPRRRDPRLLGGGKAVVTPPG